MIGEHALKALEFTKIAERVAECAALGRTKRELAAMRPESDLGAATALLDRTEEAESLLFRYRTGGIEFYDDPESALARAELGAPLSQAELLRVGRLLKSARLARAAVLRDGVEAPLLGEAAEGLYSDPAFEREIFSKILSEDEMSDDASPLLSDLRRRERRLGEGIREKLNSFIRGGMAKYLQDAIVTKRGDRYVLPVRQEFRGQVRGLVHDRSSSGSTLFIEPEAVLEMNNELKTLQIEEENEIARILAELSARVGAIVARLRADDEILALLDGFFARAVYSENTRSTRPRLNDRGVISLKKARHPLIDPARVVPVDVAFGSENRILLVTGPNTGGKTVTLKLAGLASLLAMSGLFVPAAEGSELSVFDEIFTDIGDDQSIEQSLSTFSSHMKNVIGILAQVNERSLVLIDEIGAGTDPEEGAALARAVLERLLDQKASGIVTTHYSSLKEFAFTDPRIRNASMAFDAETFTPLFRLNVGVPGSSNAIEISRKLGLGSEIADRAVSLLSDRKIDFDRVLKRAEETRLAAERERAELASRRAEAEEMRRAADEEREKLAKEREKLFASARVESRRIVAERMEEAESIVEKLKSLLEKEEIDGGDLIAARTLKNRLEREKYAIDSDPAETGENRLRPVSLPKVGERVFVRSCGGYGTVSRVSEKKKEAEVRMGDVRMNVGFSDLFYADGEKKDGNGAASVRIRRSPDRAAPRREIKVIGMTVPEALAEVDEFLDAAMLDGLGEVKIIHGSGKGILRAAVRKHLKGHPEVGEFRAGAYGEGEEGVTIVTLK